MDEIVGDEPRNKRSRCPYCYLELSTRYVKAHIANRHLHYEELPIEVPLPNRDQSADPIHEEIESKIDELPAKENQISKNYEETDANFRDESRVVSLQVDFVIGHRLGPDGSLNFKSSGLEVRYHGDQMLISHPLVAEFWFEGTRSKITCSISIHEMLFSTTVTLTGWVRSLGIIWPGCRTCAFIHHVTEVADKLKHCECNQISQAYLPFASLGGCAVGFLVCIQELLGPSKTLNAEVTKAAATLPTKAFCRRDTNLARVFKESLKPGIFQIACPSTGKQFFYRSVQKFVECWSQSPLFQREFVALPLRFIIIRPGMRGSTSCHFVRDFALPYRWCSFMGQWDFILCSLGVASSNCSLPSSCWCLESPWLRLLCEPNLAFC